MGLRLLCLATGAVVFSAFGQSVEREAIPGWENIVPGGMFVDRFEPSAQIGELSSDCWGVDGVKPRDRQNGIEEEDWSYWGGRIRKGEDGKFHLYVARWPESKGHMYWRRSTVCHAVSDTMEGPFKPLGDIGPGHNPELFRCKDGSWCIYVIGHCYRGPTANGPWTDTKLEMIGTDGKPHRDESNWSFAENEDGSILAISRNGYIWRSEDGLKPFVKQSDTSIYPAIKIDTFEDPVIWRDHAQYNVIVNDWLGRLAWHIVSVDGVNWTVMPGKAYVPGIARTRTKDGRIVSNEWYKYERMHVFQDEHGRAIQANFAVIDWNKWEDKGHDIHNSKNITIPLNPGRLVQVLPRKRGGNLWQFRIKAEKGFDPVKEVDLGSLRFGEPKTVLYGGGVRPCGSSVAGNDLVVEFPDIEVHGPLGKILGKEKSGKLLFCDFRLP